MLSAPIISFADTIARAYSSSAKLQNVLPVVLFLKVCFKVTRRASKVATVCRALQVMACLVTEVSSGFRRTPRATTRGVLVHIWRVLKVLVYSKLRSLFFDEVFYEA